ncbi:MAG: hypothetical protein ACO3JL_14230, partial [Myxococcota bacterium]
MTTWRGPCIGATLAWLVGSTGLHARPCETIARQAQLREQHADLRFAPPARPSSAGHVDSTTWPIRVHFETEALAVRAPALLGIAEDAWQFLMEEIGYPRPLPDGLAGGDERLDLYLGFVGVAGALTIAEDDGAVGDEFAVAPAYIIVSADLSDDELPTFVHHEMAHAVQFALDLEESLMFFEASAVAHERYALPGVLRWADSLDDFQAWPSAPIFTNGIDWRAVTGRASLYEFGASLFLLYLEQHHGDDDGTLIRDLWIASQQPAGSGNEPDWLDELPRLTGRGLPALVLDFASWRTLLAGWAVPEVSLPEAAALTGEALPATLRLVASALDGEPIALTRERLPHQYGCAAIETVAGLEGLFIDVEARALPTAVPEERPLGIAYVIGEPSAAIAVRGATPTTSPRLQTSLQVPPRHTLVLYVCDVGAADADELPVATDLELRLSIGAPDAGGPLPDDDGEVDAGTLGEPGTMPPACGCQQGKAPQGVAPD